MGKHRMEPPTIIYPADGSVQPVGRFRWYPCGASPQATGPSHRLMGKKVVIVGGSDEMAYQVKVALEENGVGAYRFRPLGDNYELTALALVKQVGNIDGIIDLNLETTFALGDKDVWEDALSQTIALLKAVYDDWIEETDGQRLFYVVVTHMGGQMGYTGTTFQQPLGGIWAGLAKSLNREIPNCNVKIIDYAPNDHAMMGLAPVELLLNELYRWGLFEVGYADGVRYTLTACKEEVLQPVHELTPSDLILVSGGGRGIGFALAKTLAENFGCHVIVTGRHVFPTGDELWLRLSEPEFKNYQQQQLRSILEGKGILDIRHTLEQQKRQRELFFNVKSAKEQGLRISYEVCDFTSRQQVQELVTRIGPELTGVIHNAGIDTPVRLHSKSISAFIRTIQTKVYGFLHLLETLADKKLTFFCNVGSLTGRWGGMVGQLDYAAANEGLTRLGLWAKHTLPVEFPIKTLCWPTWNRLGLITNFEATLRYMAAMHIEEGLYYWQRELLAPDSGEITFIGPIGKAFSPVLARGYPPINNLPGFERTYAQIFYLGDIQQYKPSHSLQARHTLNMGVAPFLSDFQVESTPALPISLLLEIVVCTGAWITPPEQSAEYLLEIRKLIINVQALKVNEFHYHIEKRAIGSWKHDAWVVEIELTCQQGYQRQFLAQAELVYSLQPGQDPLCPIIEQETGQEIFLPHTSLAWKGLVFKLTRWKRNKKAEGNKENRQEQPPLLHGRAVPCYESDLWTVPYPPRSYLPLTAIENVIRAAFCLQNIQSVPQYLHIASISPFACDVETTACGVETCSQPYLVGNEQENIWYVINHVREHVICMLTGIKTGTIR